MVWAKLRSKSDSSQTNGPIQLHHLGMDAGFGPFEFIEHLAQRRVLVQGAAD